MVIVGTVVRFVVCVGLVVGVEGGVVVSVVGIVIVGPVIVGTVTVGELDDDGLVDDGLDEALEDDELDDTDDGLRPGATIRSSKSTRVTSGKSTPLVGGMVLSSSGAVDVGKTSVRTELPGPMT